MLCGECKHCLPVDACDYDCECLAKSNKDISFQVSMDDDIRFYGPCPDKACPQFCATPAIRQNFILAKLQ